MSFEVKYFTLCWCGIGVANTCLTFKTVQISSVWDIKDLCSDDPNDSEKWCALSKNWTLYFLVFYVILMFYSESNVLFGRLCYFYLNTQKCFVSVFSMCICRSSLQLVYSNTFKDCVTPQNIYLYFMRPLWLMLF